MSALSSSGTVRGFAVHCGDSVEYTNRHGQSFLAIVEAVISGPRPAVLLSRIDHDRSEVTALQNEAEYPSVRFLADPDDCYVGPDDDSDGPARCRSCGMGVCPSWCAGQ